MAARVCAFSRELAKNSRLTGVEKLVASRSILLDISRSPSGDCVRHIHLHRAHRCTSVIEKDKGHWRLVTGVCVERLPVITTEPSDLETRYQDLQEHVEYVNSRLSDHEVKKKELQKRWKAKNKSDEEELELIQLQELEKEKEEVNEEALQKFVFGSRITEADRENNQKSLERKLDQTLLLLVKNDSGVWRVPETELDENETLRQAVDRHLENSCGGMSRFRVLSNTPAGVFLDKEAKPHKAKVFFHKSQLKDSHQISLDEQYQDFVWVTKDELQDYVSVDYLQALSCCLY